MLLSELMVLQISVKSLVRLPLMGKNITLNISDYIKRIQQTRIHSCRH